MQNQKCSFAMHLSTQTQPSIRQSFAGQNVFITGGTGFMGKVLIEKLLRSCPEIGTIYILMREKKNIKPNERISKLADIPLFNKLKKENGDALKKIIPITGDITQLNLGISNEDYLELIEKVSVVYHFAASIRFDDDLTDAIIKNIRATREVCFLTLKIKNIKAIAHISTMYSQVDRKCADEVLYPPHADWESMISVAENCDRHKLNLLTKKILNGFPNTYTFTKSLAEHVVNDICGNKIPVSIFRPSIVTWMHDDPLPGFSDTFTGVFGLSLAGGKGLVRALKTKIAYMDCIPVDICTKGIIIGTSLMLYKSDISVQIYNLCGRNFMHIPENYFTSEYLDGILKELTVDVIYYPRMYFIPDFIYDIYYFLCIIIPSTILDFLMRLYKGSPQKLQLAKIQRILYSGITATSYFLNTKFDFINSKFLELEYNIKPEDEDEFSYKIENMDFKDHTCRYGMYLNEYVFNKTSDSLEVYMEKIKRKLKMMKIVYYVINSLMTIFAVSIIFKLVAYYFD